MEERTHGIILRTRPLTETSLIVQWLTRDLGRISCVAKGARRHKSPFAGKLDLFYEADFSFQRSRKSDLHTLREVSLLKTHSKLREDLERLRQAAYFAVLIERFCERETSIEEFHDLMKEALDVLGTSGASAALVLGFELKFLRLAGLEPLPEKLSENANALLERLGGEPLAVSTKSSIPSALLREISSFLRRGIGTALEKLPPEREGALRLM